MENRRAGERDTSIPEVVDPRRRRKAERDIFFALATYFPDKFTDPFTEDQREMVRSIMQRARHGGDQAIAAPRGGGKTVIAESVIIMAVLTGVLRFPLLVAATGPDARRLLQNVKYEFENNDLLLADFPEVCAPIRALEGASQRGNMMTVGGRQDVSQVVGRLRDTSDGQGQ